MRKAVAVQVCGSWKWFEMQGFNIMKMTKAWSCFFNLILIYVGFIKLLRYFPRLAWPRILQPLSLKDLSRASCMLRAWVELCQRHTKGKNSVLAASWLHSTWPWGYFWESKQLKFNSTSCWSTASFKWLEAARQRRQLIINSPFNLQAQLCFWD